MKNGDFILLLFRITIDILDPIQIILFYYMKNNVLSKIWDKGLNLFMNYLFN
jgi:hypothetical protein